MSKNEKQKVKAQLVLTGGIEDFITEENKTVEFNIDGKVVKYNLPTSDEELTWAQKYVTGVDENGEPIFDLKAMRKEKIMNIVSIPYDNEVLQKLTGKTAQWKDLNVDERWKVFGKFRPMLFNKIVAAIEDEESSSDDKKKG